MNNLAIIPARGGSKRIPRKNIKNFLGKPIIAYSIKTAIDSNLFDEIMVSTDDPEIAEIAIKYGAKVPFMRSYNNSKDNSTTIEVIAEVIEKYQKNDQNFQNVCCIYPCAPLCKPEYLVEAYEKLLDYNFDSVFPVIKYSTPIQRAFKQTANKRVVLINPKYEMSRSQDLDESYFDAGQFYWMQNSRILTNNKIYTNNSGVIVLNDLQAQDIDNLIDWELAELKYKLINKNEY